MGLETGSRVNRYEIVALLGRGGMGEVYRARDEQLGREVAIKVLPAASSQDAERLRRFELEARAAAALNHPNVVTVYDVGTHEGGPYVVMELLEGQTLRQRLQGDRLPTERVLDYAQQVARGLAAAHDKGIVHRDLKPENLFLTEDGRVKILDFGLARLRALQTPGEGDSGDSTVSLATAPGVIAGTVGYMSPEQVRGEATDPRSDTFSFGAVLYEMLSGRRAFGGDSAIDTMHAILKEDPPPLASTAPALPAGLVRLVQRCLEKRAQDRFQSAHDLALALEAVSGVAPLALARVPRPTRLPFLRALVLTVAAVVVLLVVVLIWKGAIPGVRHRSPAAETPATVAEQKPRIVVLPFDNTSPEPDTEFYADGITIEIIGKLSKVEALTVLNYRTALALKGTRKLVPAIAEELHVRYVLAGTIRRSGNSLRINAALIDSTSQANLWTDQYSGTLGDVFDVQEKVARAIVDGLKLKLTVAEERGIARRPKMNVQAYDYYLRARNALIRFTPDDINAAFQLLNAAVQLFQKSRELTGENALLYAGLGYAHFQLGNTGLQQDEAFKKAESYAEQALRLDPETAEAHMVLGLVQGTFHGNQQQAVRHFKQALRIDPNNSDVLFWLATTYACVGKTSAGMALADRGTEIDPPWMGLAGRTWVYFLDGRFDLSAKSQEKVVAVVSVPASRLPWAYALSAGGRSEEALAVLESIGPAASPDINVRLAHFLKLALQGKKAKVPELLSPGFVTTARRDMVYSLMVADSYAMLDDREHAWWWLENAVNRGFINYPYLSKYDRFLTKLRGEPRFQKLITRVKEESERFEE
jgi:serine/threonine protein kinase/tetratricopeptide (TPR) repeat protein